MTESIKVFPNDRDYTYEAMMEQFNIIELDLRDGYYNKCASTPEKMRKQLDLVSLHYRDKSWQECKCSFEKHLPTVSGLSKVGLRNAQSKHQKNVLGAIRDDSLRYTRRLEEGQLTQDEAHEFGNWVEMAIEELKQMENEWGVCVVETNGFLETLSGLSGEGVGFTEEDSEKKYMRDVRDNARSFAYRMSTGNISEAEADAIRDWARQQRRRLSRKQWVGDLPKTSRKDEDAEDKFDKKPKNPQPKKKGSLKGILSGAKKMGENGSNCKKCTTIPDKYKNGGKTNGSSKDDYVMVTVPSSTGERAVPIRKVGRNEDIQWVSR